MWYMWKNETKGNQAFSKFLLLHFYHVYGTIWKRLLDVYYHGQILFQNFVVGERVNTDIAIRPYDADDARLLVLWVVVGFKK